MQLDRDIFRSFSIALHLEPRYDGDNIDNRDKAANYTRHRNRHGLVHGGFATFSSRFILLQIVLKHSGKAESGKDLSFMLWYRFDDKLAIGAIVTIFKGGFIGT